ncbi:mechanosensitive ion channel family protein [Motiliproteus sp. SC1-56]|uniref:mechanosensitive ion channel family protein n=1 Tax=Motiliproteus sp. SC1-56 TaxID=2799565 RepID=UPI001A8D8512|nr:mechanosensitive ion channel family protein [Motiliproteus sp. SC1-56]
MEQGLNQIWSKLGLLGNENLWIVEVFTAVFITLLANFLLKRVFARLAGKFENTGTPWDDAILAALRTPASWLVWVVGLAWAAGIVDQRTESSILAVVDPVRETLVIILLAWFLARLVGEGEKVLTEPGKVKKPMDITAAQAISKLLRASVVITAGLVILQTLGFSVSGVLAFGGIGGMAVGFAAKDLLANFFGGLAIYMDKPFKVGDWIRSPDKEVEGTVESIGFRQTRIRTFDKRPLYVPNATFANISVENPSRMTHRRIFETIGVRYDDALKVRSIVDDVRTMLEAHEEIDTSQTLIVNLNKFGPSSLDFFIYTFTKTTNWIRFHEIKQDVLLRIMDIIDDHGAEVAFPTHTLHLHEVERGEDGVTAAAPARGMGAQPEPEGAPA